MKDEDQDPELEFVRANWDAPSPSAGFHQRVGTAYYREFAVTSRWQRWIVTVAAAAAVALALFTLSHRQPAYRPVFQPRFIVISQGEHP